MGLPKSIIKKYGISKKAWQVYRRMKKKVKRHVKKIKTKTKRVRRVARRRRRRTYRRSRSSISLNSILKGVGVGAVAENFGMSGLLKYGAGYFIAGVPGAIGAAALDFLRGNFNLGLSGQTGGIKII